MADKEKLEAALNSLSEIIASDVEEAISGLKLKEAQWPVRASVALRLLGSSRTPLDDAHVLAKSALNNAQHIANWLDSTNRTMAIVDDLPVTVSLLRQCAAYLIR